MLYKVKRTRVCQEDYLEKIIKEKVDKKNLYLANKILSVKQKDNERKLYISRCKELVYKVSNGAYLTLSDISHLNRMLVTLGLNHKFDLEQYERFVDSRNIVTFAGELDLDEKQEDFVYLSYIQNPLEYGIDLDKLSYDDMVSYLNSLNKFIYRATNKVINNGTIDKNDISENMIVSNSIGFYSILDDLNKDSLDNIDLSMKYAYRRHL